VYSRRVSIARISLDPTTGQRGSIGQGHAQGQRLQRELLVHVCLVERCQRQNGVCLFSARLLQRSQYETIVLLLTAFSGVTPWINFVSGFFPLRPRDAPSLRDKQISRCFKELVSVHFCLQSLAIRIHSKVQTGNIFISSLLLINIKIHSCFLSEILSD